MNIDFAKGFYIGVVFMFIVFILILAFDPEGPGYRQGQIDALTGVVKYELIENPDQTKEWKRVKE